MSLPLVFFDWLVDRKGAPTNLLGEGVALGASVDEGERHSRGGSWHLEVRLLLGTPAPGSVGRGGTEWSTHSTVQERQAEIESDDGLQDIGRS